MQVGAPYVSSAEGEVTMAVTKISSGQWLDTMVFPMVFPWYFHGISMVIPGDSCLVAAVLRIDIQGEVTSCWDIRVFIP